MPDARCPMPEGGGGAEDRFNPHSRAVTVARLRKLLNHAALERAEAGLAGWIRSK